jgi:hypothetical protein
MKTQNCKECGYDITRVLEHKDSISPLGTWKRCPNCNYAQIVINTTYLTIKDQRVAEPVKTLPTPEPGQVFEGSYSSTPNQKSLFLKLNCGVVDLNAWQNYPDFDPNKIKVHGYVKATLILE